MSLEHSPARSPGRPRGKLQDQPKTETQRLAELRKTLQRRSWTVLEWCAMRGYSRPFFYTLKKNRNAPDVIGEGKAQRITDDADARWIKRQEAQAKKRR
jgi:hypothetical protein